MQLVFDDAYFCDEQRDGFLVTEAMKRYWAASLQTVVKFADVCKKHKLKWWADWGTMLGAYRHKGFIPWDDEIDIGMMREDFDRFLFVAEKELADELIVDTYDNPWHKYYGAAVINNHRGTLFSEEVLEEYFMCPFPVGFDLYVYDNAPMDPMALQQWRLKGMKKCLIMELIRKKGLDDPQTKDALFAAGYKKKYDNKDKGKILTEVGMELNDIAQEFRASETEYIMPFVYYALEEKAPKLEKEWFNEVVELPFESISLQEPKHVEEVLSKLYGADYMAPKQGLQTHDYPLYRRDIMAMISFLEAGGLFLKDLPPELEYIRREADLRGIKYTK